MCGGTLRQVDESYSIGLAVIFVDDKETIPISLACPASYSSKLETLARLPPYVLASRKHRKQLVDERERGLGRFRRSGDENFRWDCRIVRMKE